MGNATLYVSSVSSLDENTVRAAAVDADVVVEKRGLLRGTLASMKVRWPGVEAELRFLSAADLHAHLDGFARFAIRYGAEPDSATLAKIRSTKLVVGLVVSGDDESDRVPRFVWALARELDALVFLEPGEAYDASGTRVVPVAEAAAAPDRYDEDAEDVDDAADDELDPPTPERIARRALALCAVTYRALLENAPPDDATDRIERAREWVVGADLWDELEPDERSIVDAPLGALDRRTTVNASWRSEGLAVLAWYLGRAELPPHDETCEPDALWAACGFLRELPPPLVVDPTTRGAAERTRMGSQLLGLHWRLRDFRLRPQPMDFRKFAESCWFGTMNVDGISFAGDDLALRGSAIANAPPELVGLAASIAVERHQAINWLDGYDATYSEVDTST